MDLMGFTAYLKIIKKETTLRKTELQIRKSRLGRSVSALIYVNRKRAATNSQLASQFTPRLLA